MNRNLKWKIAFVFFLVIFAVITVTPSLYKDVPDWWRKYMAPQGLRLGLDLQGGMHLILRVDLDKAVENSLDLAAQDLRASLNEQKITLVPTPTQEPGLKIFTLPNTGAVDSIKKLVENDFPNLDTEITAEEGTFPRIQLRLSDTTINNIRKNSVAQSLEIIRNRIDQFGVAEPVIVRQGEDEIVVQLPGVKDPKRALSLIGQTAQLEFKLVDDSVSLNLQSLVDEAVQSGKWNSTESRKKLNQILQQQLPPGDELYFSKEVNEVGKEVRKPILLKTQVLMTGDMVKDAQVRVGGNFNEPYVSLDLTDRGGKVFGQVTADNVNKRFAIILDEVVRSAPVIREKILGGSAQISGNFKYEEAADLAIVLRVGALPAPVSIIQNLTVGASLGQDSINKGLMSGLIGTAMVILFMVVYYHQSGVIANIALLINIMLLFSGLAIMGATLTLPGIAGIILSIGMAVDTNVLIYERMRDEFAIGKTLRSGVESGFDKAFWTIVDAHVTTLITALILFIFGTGPIKGFAVTLSLGVILNLFTALYVSRLAYDVLHAKRMLKSLKFLQLIKKPNLNYMKIRNITFTVSIIFSLIGVVAFVQIWRGQANMGVDFAGGSMLQFKAANTFSMEEVRQAMARGGHGDLELQEVTSENRLIVKLKKSSAEAGNLHEQIEQLLAEQLPDKNFELESQTAIGSSVSADLRNKAIQAILISFAGIIIYLAIRFDLSYGMAAAIATLHDVLAVLGICYLLGLEMNLLVVTALLTIAGYSLNDTVVIFDRIRENVNKLKTPVSPDIINLSMNQVLSRSIITSLTVFLVLLALYTLGGQVIHDFSFALLIGVIIGTYSSIFIASPVLFIWQQRVSAKAIPQEG